MDLRGAFFLYLLVLVFGSMAAWHNVGLGRSDLQGARRLAWFVLGLGLLEWLVGRAARRRVDRRSQVVLPGHGPRGLDRRRPVDLLSRHGAFRPPLRPQTMISWSRLLAGRFRDPLVGRDCS